MNSTTSLPVAVIGAGPVGLAAAAHLLERGETPLVLEAGPSAGSAVRQWSHVRMFSPWRYNIDPASRRLLEKTGWREPDPARLPTGGEIVRDYLEPLANRTALQSHIEYNARVVALTRAGLDKVRSAHRETRPFSIRTMASDGSVQTFLAKAVIDASGTATMPNPMGSDGLHPVGEADVRDLIAYGIPDTRGEQRDEYAGRTVLVVGGGHSAFNVVLDLLELKRDVPDTRIVWAMRKQSLANVFGGGAADALPARGALGQKAREAIERGALELLTPFGIHHLARLGDDRILVSGELRGETRSVRADRIIVATGFRPDVSWLREIRLELDPWLESARAIGPLIDPNVHSCGTVRPHGARELAHPEHGFYIVGMKSYGRAPTFLLATGYEQARSVVAELVGDREAAARVELDLPETGVCSLSNVDPAAEAESGCGCGGSGEADHAVPAAAAPAGASGCCGGAPERDASACCRLDEEKKSAGEAGCGCGDTVETKPVAILRE
jgi:hypothetical protein